MDTIRAVLTLTVGLAGFSSCLTHAATIPKMDNDAQEIRTEETNHTPVKAMNLEWTPNIGGDAFVMIPNEPKKQKLPSLTSAPNQASEVAPSKTVVKYKANDKESFEDRVISFIPQSKRLKNIWEFADGESDIYFAGLRVDRGNKGVKYSTHYVPMIGEMETVEMEFMAGEEMELSLESRHIPFAGELDGFNFKSTVNPDNSKVFARYTIKFD